MVSVVLVTALIALIFNFTNGMNDAANCIASTMGKGIVDENCIDVYVILAALIGSVLWIFTCTRLGLPISASHALVGGLIGPVWFVYGSFQEFPCQKGGQDFQKTSVCVISRFFAGIRRQ